jgi:UDP-N-acetylmuramate--alanine ligase
MQKIKVGIFFGGQSREREVSFAGGRTVYDNLNKELFEAIPIFVDSFGNFCLLNWEHVYKGSIRDFLSAYIFTLRNAKNQLLTRVSPQLPSVCRELAKFGE